MQFKGSDDVCNRNGKILKRYLLCCCYDNTFAACPALIKTEIPSFCLNQRLFSPVMNDESKDITVTTSVPSRTLFWFFDRRSVAPTDFPRQ